MAKRRARTVPLESPSSAALRALADTPEGALATLLAPYASGVAAARENRVRLQRARSVVSEALVGAGLDGAEAERRAAELLRVEADPRKLPADLAGRTHGVAAFVGPEGVRPFALGQAPAEEVRIGDCFALRLLLRAVQSDTRFRVLALAQNSVALFEGDAHGLHPDVLPDLPSSLEEALGTELGGHRLGLVSTPAAGIRGARFYGLHDANTERALDLERFHRVVARALEKTAAAGEPPLVLATDESNAGRFRKVAQLPALVADTAVGSPEHLSPAELFARAWPAVAAELGRRERARADDYERARSLGKGLTAIDRIAVAAVTGRVRRLWIDEGAEVPGRLDFESGRVVAAEPRAGDALDALATAVLRRGGEVIVGAAGSLPAPAAAVAELR
jgi:hypothetical protein